MSTTSVALLRRQVGFCAFPAFVAQAMATETNLVGALSLVLRLTTQVAPSFLLVGAMTSHMALLLAIIALQLFPVSLKM